MSSLWRKGKANKWTVRIYLLCSARLFIFKVTLRTSIWNIFTSDKYNFLVSKFNFYAKISIGLLIWFYRNDIICFGIILFHYQIMLKSKAWKINFWTVVFYFLIVAFKLIEDGNLSSHSTMLIAWDWIGVTFSVRNILHQTFIYTTHTLLRKSKQLCCQF